MSRRAALMPARAVVAVFAVLAMAAPALAQRPDPPPREREVLTTQLVVTAASTRQDAEQPAEVVADLPQLASSIYADIHGVLRYTPNTAGGLTFGLTLSSAVRRFDSSSEFMIIGHSAGATLGWAPSARTRLVSTGSFSYVPSYSINATPLADAITAGPTAGTLPANALDYSLTKRTLYGAYGGLSLNQKLTRRLDLTMSYTGTQQAFALPEDPSYLSHSGSGRLTYALTRGLAVRAGFGRRLASYDTATGTEQVAIDDIDVGLNFTEAVGLTRTTRFAFTTGSSLRSGEGERRAALIGTATLSQELGRRGQIALSYSRGSELVPGFSRPVFADSLSLSSAVRVAGELQASVVSVASLGEVGRSRTGDNRVQSMSAAARLTYPLWRAVQTYGEYLVYRGYIDRDVSLLATVPRDSLSHTVRVGVVLSVPLVTAPPPRERAQPAPERN